MGTTKSGPGNPDTVNQGPAPQRRREEEADITGNARKRGEDPSPGNRDRGERSDADRQAPVDIDSAHERAK